MLWRLENGELEHIRPKVSSTGDREQVTALLTCALTLSCLSPQIVVVWVGTNNHGHTAEQVTGGITAIVHLVNQRQPQARVVVLVRMGWRAGRITTVRWGFRYSQSGPLELSRGSRAQPSE